jgi:hypothetical protein
MLRRLPLGFWLSSLVIVGLIVFAVHGLSQDIHAARSAMPTTLHVTRCWSTPVKGEHRRCAIQWSTADGHRGSASIVQSDSSIAAGSTIQGWATSDQAWTDPPTSAWQWPFWPILAIACLVAAVVVRYWVFARLLRGKHLRSGPSRPWRTLRRPLGG